MLAQQPTVYGIAADDAKRRVESGSSRRSDMTRTDSGGRSTTTGLDWSGVRFRQRLIRLATRLSIGHA